MQETTSRGLDLGQALGALLRAYLEAARKEVDELPGGPRGYQVMAIAADGACGNQATIAEILGLDRTVMTHLIDDLERAELVTRRPDPADRRARQVLLTESGRATFEQASARIQDVESALLGPLSESEADVFRDLLGRVVGTGPGIDPRPGCDFSDPPDC